MVFQWMAPFTEKMLSPGHVHRQSEGRNPGPRRAGHAGQHQPGPKGPKGMGVPFHSLGLSENVGYIPNEIATKK